VGFILRHNNPENFAESVALFRQLQEIDKSAAFYAGIVIDDYIRAQGLEENAVMDGGSLSAREIKLRLFFAALDSPSAPARREAGEKLIPLIMETQNENTLKGLFNEVHGRLASESINMEQIEKNSGRRDNLSDWNSAISLFAELKTSPKEAKEKLLNDILGLFYSIPDLEIKRWMLGEIYSLNDSEPFLLPHEATALSNKVEPLPYQIYLVNIKPALENALMFFRYPELITDLGRAFQYTPAMHEEGARLFRLWDSLLVNPEKIIISESGENEDYHELRTFIKNLGKEEREAIRFPILFYLGRIERARRQYSVSSIYFADAHQFAPDDLQSDACIWYILMNTFNSEPEEALPLILNTMPDWKDVSYFADILDRLSVFLAGKRQWTGFEEIVTGLEKLKSEGALLAGAPLAQYAYILGRAAEEGYLKTDLNAKDLFRIAFLEEESSFYYRIMSAIKLGESFTLPGGNSGKRNSSNEDEGEFLLGFFNYGAASLALPYIKKLEKQLSIAELEKIAGALASAGYYKDSLDLVSRYMSREDYELSRNDLLLFYPRPFREIIEKYAKEAGLGEEMLYALIRTESYFTPDIVSSAGAIGLTQLMESTALDMAGRIARQAGPDYRENMNLKDPEINVHIGSFYLSYLINQMESPMFALLAYNGGMGRIRRWINADRQKDGGLSPDIFLETIEYSETREYGRRILAQAAVYGYLYYKKNMEAVASDIYRKVR